MNPKPAFDLKYYRFYQDALIDAIFYASIYLCKMRVYSQSFGPTNEFRQWIIEPIRMNLK